jgi:hypothetical protein
MIKYLIAIMMAILLVFCGAGNAIKWEQMDLDKTLPSGEGIKFSGTPPATTTGTLYTGADGILRFGDSVISGRITPFEAQIMKNDAGNTVLLDSDGNIILTSSNSGGVINYAINHSYYSIYIHDGNYTITETIDLRAKACHLLGAGKNTILYGSVNPIFNIKNTGSYYNDVSVSNLYVKGAGDNAYDAFWIARLALNVKLFHSVWIENCHYGIWIGDTSFGNDYYSVDIKDCYMGIYINSTALVTTQRFFGGSIRECTLYGVRIKDSSVGHLFQGMIIEYNAGTADVYISCDTDPYFTSHITFRDCWFEDDTTPVFVIGGSQSNSWLGPFGVTVENCHFAMVADSMVAYRVTSGRRNIFKGNVLDRAGYKGNIEITGAYAVSNIVVENVDAGGATEKWILTDTGTSTVSSPNYWN